MRQSISLIILSFLLLNSLLFGQGNLVLYRWDTDAKVYVWKAFGDSDINPKYEGEIKNGKPDGFGILTYINLVSCSPVCGKKYVGEFKDGLRHGQGTHTWSDGSMYVGKYKDGKRNGHGTMTYSSGNTVNLMGRGNIIHWMENFGTKEDGHTENLKGKGNII